MGKFSRIEPDHLTGTANIKFKGKRICFAENKSSSHSLIAAGALFIRGKHRCERIFPQLIDKLLIPAQSTQYPDSGQRTAALGTFERDPVFDGRTFQCCAASGTLHQKGHKLISLKHCRLF
jgi:hypothetical protein